MTLTQRSLSLPLGYLVALTLVAGCASEPCGLGLKVDDRPLPEAWTKVLPVYPQGATSCYNPELPDSGPGLTRSISLPDQAPAAALKTLSEHLKAHDWRATMVSPPTVAEREGLVWWAFHKQHKTTKIELWCSAAIDKGWCHLTLLSPETERAK